ncbi:hypothetical protein [Streptomyces sp. NPDC089915]|uniref:hypothetical protein n=1 Tax=Streptomyces sp. NPDC089915 TaxID=3155186 RepID=UPI003441AA14
MATTALQRDAERLALYTGLPYQSTHQIAGAIRRRAAVIPRPSPQQELLERWLLRRVAWPMYDPVRPWGITWVRPEADGLTVHFEGDYLAGELAGLLPPRFTADGLFYGIPGARFFPASKKGVEMILPGTSARIRLAGIGPKAWKAAWKKEQHEAAKEGDVLCHLGSPRSWTHRELLYVAGAGIGAVPRARRAEASAWLASALLRRVGLWSAAGIALSNTSWTNPENGGEQWIIEHIHQPTPDSLHHDELVGLLTDPEWGMRVKVTDRWCSCARQGEMCLVKLRSTQDEAGELELRFARRDTPRSVQAWGGELYAAKTLAAVIAPTRLRLRPESAS